MDRKLHQFGSFLKARRKQLGMTQGELAAKAAEALGDNSPRGVTQGLIAHYECGNVINPDAQFLLGLARVYGLTYVELLAEFLCERYSCRDMTVSEEEAQLEEEQWGAVRAVVRSNSQVTSSVGCETAIRARRLASDKLVILDAKGLALWEKTYSPFEEFWIVSPDFLDVRCGELAIAIASRLMERVPITYFITPEFYPRFLILAKEVLPKVEPRLTTEMIEDCLTAVELGASAKLWMCADFNVANPCSAAPCGFQIHRTDEGDIFALMLSRSRVTTYAEGLRAWRTDRTQRVSEIQRKLHSINQL